MVGVCFIGIFVGTCALALVAFVMDGFERATYEKLQGIHPQLIIRSFNQQALNEQKITDVITKEFMHVAALSPVSSNYVLVQSPDDEGFSLLSLRGIDPDKESLVTTLHKTIIAPSSEIESLTILKQPQALLVGEQFANDQKKTIGDTIELMIPEQGSSKNIRFSSHQGYIAGIFKTGIDDFDAHVIFSSLDFLQELFPESGISSIGVRLDDQTHEVEIIQKLRERLHLHVFSWKDLYPALLSALTLEKYVMFFVLILITLVASMSIVSLLFMLITQKRLDIALYKSMGLADRVIQQIFITIGMVLALAASSLGLCIAIIIGFALDTFQLIKLPDVYYVSHMPAHISLTTCFTVFFVVLILSFFACWFPTRSIHRINVSQILRYEG